MTSPITASASTRRRSKRVALGIALVGAVMFVSACTPSGSKAEQLATAQIHHMITGAANSPGSVNCGEFTSEQTDVYTGICSIYGVSYAVTSTYANQHQSATVAVGRWTGEGGTCSVVKAGDNWGIFQWNGAPVCSMN